ncbi:MAG: excinuclease ABC subunit UvrC [Clostridia bacterium]|nr:excinuclease ABC subunit UvrC [Clostridia bacterium]NLS84953.1 excinuclease ABC subunit UvrC [Oscillospiraceae bacterium]
MTKNELWLKAKALPLLPGVYIIRDKTNEIIYIGKAKRLRTRVAQYFRAGVPHDAKVTKMIEHAFEFDVIVTQSEFEALVLECSQIKQHKPKYNILLKDDKGYSYIKVTKDAWPRISAVLQKDDDDAEYIGPYTSSFAVRNMVETAEDVFRLPRCNKRFPQDIGKGRPCLNAHIGLCMAVCGGKITHADYMQAVNGALQLIKRGQNEILKILKQNMEDAAEALNFERAALIRDQIVAIEKVNRGQKVVRTDVDEQDVVALAASGKSVCASILRFRGGRLVDKQEFVFKDTQDIDAVREELLPQFYLDADSDIPKIIAIDALPPDADALTQLLSETKGQKVRLYTPQRGDTEKLVQMARTNAFERLARDTGRATREQKALDETAALLGLPEAPTTIESYDISNWGDGTSVCGMVVFENGKPKKAGYRRFKMQTVMGTDDYASMAEALSRRAAEYEKGTNAQFKIKPSLLLIDGGQGQVSVVRGALAGTQLADVPMFGMVKDDKHRTRGLVNEQGEITLSMHRGVFTFITAIQDETHRFANDYRKRLQKGRTYALTLTQIDGIGPSTAKALMAHFKTLTAVKEASEEQLAEVKGVGAAAAKRIWEFFR